MSIGKVYPKEKDVICMKMYCFFIVLVILSIPAYANEVSLYVPAVRETDYGYQGVLGKLTVIVKEGNGHVYVDTLPLTEIDTQSSARLAKEVTEDILNVKLDNYDLFFIIRSDSPIVGGPSAGGAMTAAAIASFLNLSVDNSIIMTGTINPDGSIGPIGGIFEKAQAVAKNNGTVFLVPEGQSIIRTQETKQMEASGIVKIVSTPVTIDLKQYAKEKWGMQIIEISNIRDAVKYMAGYEIKEPGQGIAKENPYLDAIMKEMAEEKLKITEKRLADAKERLSKVALPYDYTVQLQKLIEEQEKSITEARGLFSSGKYYSSSSRLFIISINVAYAKNAIEFLESKNSKAFAENLIGIAADNVKIVQQRVNQSMNEIDNMTDIEVIAASEERAMEAQNYVNDAWQSFYREKYFDAIYYASYATERANTADTWLGLIDKFSGSSISFDFSKLRNLAERRIEDATSSIIYASTLGIGIESENELLEKARENYNNGVYSTALFNAITARAAANLKMEIRGLSEEGIAAKIAKYENDALIAIQKSEQYGSFPILAISYLEYGKSFSDSDKASALRYMKYAKEFADASREILKVIDGRTGEEQTPAIAPSQKQDETLIIIISAFAAGVLCGVAVGIWTKRAHKKGKMRLEHDHEISKKRFPKP